MAAPAAGEGEGVEGGKKVSDSRGLAGLGMGLTGVWVVQVEAAEADVDMS